MVIKSADNKNNTVVMTTNNASERPPLAPPKPPGNHGNEVNPQGNHGNEVNPPGMGIDRKGEKNSVRGRDCDIVSSVRDQRY